MVVMNGALGIMHICDYAIEGERAKSDHTILEQLLNNEHPDKI